VRVSRLLDRAAALVLADGCSVETAIERAIRRTPPNQTVVNARGVVIDYLCAWWNGAGQSKNPWSWERIREYLDGAPNEASLLEQCADFWRGGN